MSVGEVLGKCRESFGTFCIGFIVIVLIVLLILRMQDWTITAIESMVALALGGGAIKAFKFNDEQNTFLYPIGLFFGLIVCAFVLVSPYARLLLQFAPTPTNISVTTTIPTISPTGTPVLTTAITPIATMTPTMTPPAATSLPSLGTPWILLLIIVLAVGCLIAYWLEKQKPKQ